GPLPGVEIPLHFAGIFALRRQVQDVDAGWLNDDDDELIDAGVSHFPIVKPSVIHIEGAELGAGLDSSRQDPLLPTLQAVVQANAGHGFDIDPTKADTIAQIPIRVGTLEPFIFGSDSIVS